MTLLIVGLTSPLQQICKMTMKIIDKNIKPEVSILFAPETKNHQKNGQKQRFLGLLTLRSHYRPQEHGKWMKISGKIFNRLKKHQKIF